MKNLFNFKKNGSLVFVLNCFSLFFGVILCVLYLKFSFVSYVICSFIYSVFLFLISFWWDDWKI